MELRHLRYFVAVAEELHFRRAAERLHVAQPAVSEQVRKLEEELGIRLFKRTQRSVLLTDAGAAMLDEARRVLHQAERAMAVARDAHDVAAARLRVGYLPDSVPPAVPRALQDLQTRMPNTRVTVETGNSRNLIEDVRAERLDAAVVSLPAPGAGLERTLLGPQSAVVALPVMHRHATAAAIDLARVAPERIILLAREVNPAFHDGIVSNCRAAGISPTYVHTLEPRVELALLAVSAGDGIAILLESVVGSVAVPGVRFVPLAADQPICESAVLTRPNSTDLATRAFTHSLFEAARRVSLAPAATAAPLVAA
ncbi:MAG TPA: LysR substrate-binding domain-containing protein [Thermoleophilaceae bacterium]|nr:LysR substrate-binding domain-containing protein [Thermoleophilaceae bacterium]